MSLVEDTLALVENRQSETWYLSEVQSTGKLPFGCHYLGLCYLVCSEVRGCQRRDGTMEDLDNGEVHVDVHRNSGHLGRHHHNVVLFQVFEHEARTRR